MQVTVICTRAFQTVLLLFFLKQNKVDFGFKKRHFSEVIIIRDTS